MIASKRGALPTDATVVTSPRSPDRQALAAAIQAHADAVARHERIRGARAQLDDEYFDKLQPTVRRAMDALSEAKSNEPRRFVDAFLGEAQAEGQSLAEAEKTLREAEAAVEHVQKARATLLTEAGRAEFAVEGTKRDLESAVHHVIFTDPQKDALVAEFQRTGRRLLRLARVLKTIRVHTDGLVSDPASGLSFVLRVGDIARSGMDGSLYTPDPAWGAAVVALRSDPDAELPGLPEPEPDDAGDGTPKAA